MKTQSRVLLLILIIFTITSCATGAMYQQQSPSKNSALVYVYRTNKMYGMMVRSDVLIDGQNRGKVANGGYVKFNVSPGTHTFALSIWGNKTKKTLTVRAGQIYYLRQDIVDSGVTMTVWLGNTPTLRRMDEEQLNSVSAAQAQRDLASLRSSQ